MNRCDALYRQKTEAVLRYQLYVDCMPVEGMGEAERETLGRMVTIARSSPRPKEPRYYWRVG